MAREAFYHATTKKVLVAFATIFDEITYVDDHGRLKKVPLVFAQKEKFIDIELSGQGEYDMDSAVFDVALPKMGFELTGLNFAPERHVNPLHQITATDLTGQDHMMYNRIPYDITFDLYIAARKLNDSLKIVEQIIPFFTPELTLTIRDMDDFKNDTNLPIVLNSVAVNIDYEGSLDTKRVIMWTLNFTAKAFYYPDIRRASLIKQTLMDFRTSDFEREFERITSTVTPIDAGVDDPHVIIDEKQEMKDDTN